MYDKGKSRLAGSNGDNGAAPSQPSGDPRGELIGFCKVTRDLTEREAHEASLREAYETTSRLKSEFLANMSHEIRSPMHAVLSAVRLLSESPLNTEQGELVSIMRDSGAMLLNVINDILDYSKLSSGGFAVISSDMCVPDIVQSVVKGFSMQIYQKERLKLTMRISQKVPKFARGDSFRFRQVLQNILSNAIKFTDEGTVHLDVENLEDNGLYDKLQLEVTDSGIGIPPEEAQSLFMPFTQADSSSTKRHQGTGLGLSISRSLANLMGGDVTYTPNPSGRGSIFTFVVKVLKADGARGVSPSSASLSTALPGLAPKQAMIPAALCENRRILVVEDNLINQKILLKMLLRLGLDKVDVAGDGQRAVDMFAKGPRYDLILMDINLPILDGK